MRFDRMSIAKRITVLYGGVFSFAIIVLSIVMLYNVAAINESMMKQEISDAISSIEESISAGKELTQASLQALLENKYVNMVVIKVGEDEFLTNAFGELPPFISRPEFFDRPHGEKWEAEHPEEELPGTVGTAAGEAEKTGADVQKPERETAKTGEQRPGPELPPGSRYDYTIQVDGGHEFMLVRSSLSYGGENYFIQAFKMLDGKYNYVGMFAIRLFALDILGIFLAVLVGRYISHLILKPVKTIRQTAERISIEDLSRRIVIGGPEDEMKELAVTFNSMIDRLEESFKRQNQFISDASHELRTPISVIQGYANLLNRWGKDDPTVLQESIDSILAETDHMGMLIKQLLFLAKSDQNKNHIQKKNISLNMVVREVVKELELTDSGREVSYEEACEISVTADANLLKQLFWIYAENAVKYTKPDAGQICFWVGKEGAAAVVRVRDNGAGIREEDIPNIFDRFYRADKSRNKDIPGTGLGLSIAKWIVEVHGGKIAVLSEMGSYTEFVTRFPLDLEDEDKRRGAK